MARHTRYQGLIIQDDKILLIQHSPISTGLSYWVIPGGGLDGSETEAECVKREMREETNLEVKVVKLLIDEPAHPDGIYKWRKSYLCIPVGGVASPGYEPEPEAAASYSISAVRWFDLKDERDWGELQNKDPYTYPQLVNIRQVLGYSTQIEDRKK